MDFYADIFQDIIKKLKSWKKILLPIKCYKKHCNLDIYSLFYIFIYFLVSCAFCTISHFQIFHKCTSVHTCNKSRVKFIQWINCFVKFVVPITKFILKICQIWLKHSPRNSRRKTFNNAAKKTLLNEFTVKFLEDQSTCNSWNVQLTVQNRLLNHRTKSYETILSWKLFNSKVLYKRPI